jgi:Arc/MetJ-type ribon-helix-helix transcriptional regulator
MPDQPATSTTATQAPTTHAQTADATPASFEEFLEAQPEAIRGLYASHSEALLNTVRATRSERDQFAAQIKKLSKGLDEGSEAKRQLDEMATQLEKTERRASFLEQAMQPEIQCKNARAAFLLAEAENLFDKKGSPDWAAIRREAPELFGLPTANANAGQGTAQPPAQRKNMNDFIRKASGRS